MLRFFFRLRNVYGIHENGMELIVAAGQVSSNFSYFGDKHLPFYVVS